ncbi:hypothetical protein KUCAC02_035324 [Chaenocephalus aceratus]|nr:hypothetical protein KUCAC02_035324 [Chaenocephalus aceratus]
MQGGWEVPPTERNALKGDLTCSGVSIDQGFESHLSDLDAFPPAEEVTAGGRSGPPEEPEDRGVNEEGKDKSSESPKPSSQIWRDWSCLENTIHSMLSSFLEQTSRLRS